MQLDLVGEEILEGEERFKVNLVGLWSCFSYSVGYMAMLPTPTLGSQPEEVHNLKIHFWHMDTSTGSRDESKERVSAVPFWIISSHTLHFSWPEPVWKKKARNPSLILLLESHLLMTLKRLWPRYTADWEIWLRDFLYFCLCFELLIEQVFCQMLRLLYTFYTSHFLN